MVGDGGNTALRMRLDEAAVSNAGLARAVVAAAAKEGIHLGTDTTSVKRMLCGCQPRWPVPRLVAAVLSQRLQREVTVTECGFADRTLAQDDLYDGLSYVGTLDGTVRTVVELSGRDMRRRQFLLGSMFSAGRLAEPVLYALTVPPEESTARVAGRRIGIADVEIMTEQVVHLGQLDHRYGSGRVRAQVVSLLHREANAVLHGTYSEKTGKALLTAVAKTTRLAGYTAADLGRHALAQRYYIQALDLAMRAGNRAYAAELLSEMSRMTLLIGQNSLTEHDRLPHARQAVALARSGLTVAQGKAASVLVAELHALEGRGLALLGDTRAAGHAVLAAERLYESSRPDDTAPVFYTDAAIASELGRCLHDVGESAQAIKLSTAALHGYESWRVRNRCWVQTDLASAHLLGRDLEQAATFGRDALRTAAEVSSNRVLERLRTLQRQVAALRSASPHLADLDERIADFITRITTRRQHDDL